MMIGTFAGLSALVAAVATVVGAVTLGMFFAKGGKWGLWNDIASIVLMLAMIPVAFAIAIVHGLSMPLAQIALATGLVGMIGNATSQALLVLRKGTFEQLLPWTLGFGAVVGVWYLLIGALGPGGAFRYGLDLLAIGSGLGFILVGFGFWRGGQRDPLAAIGGFSLFLASTGFLAWIGIYLLAGRITPDAAG